MQQHYFDYASSCPPFLEALAEFSRVSADFYGNPSSAHTPGRAAHKILETAKHRLKELCRSSHSNLILTSGGTEANNLVIRGIMEKHPKGRLLLAADVHASAWFAKDLYRKRVDVLPLEPDGKLSLEKLQRAIGRRTLLFSAVHVCNETGVAHNIAAFSDICRQSMIRFHCDGVQALGHVPVSLQDIPVDFYSFSSHKFGGPRGTGGVLTNSPEFAPQIMGGGQEHEWRAGTENLPGLAAAVKALEITTATITNESARLAGLAESLLSTLTTEIPDARLNSSDAGLPGLVSISIPGTIGPNVVAEMSLRGFAISAGSACHSDAVEPSRVITSLGRSAEEALGTLRISMGRMTTKAEVEQLAITLVDVVKRQRMLT